jgi:hypothetical protein
MAVSLISARLTIPDITQYYRTCQGAYEGQSEATKHVGPTNLLRHGGKMFRNATFDLAFLFIGQTDSLS